ncbi:MAG: S1C family serine protease [Myxococcota bacterium]
MLAIVPLALAAEPVDLAPFRIGAEARSILGIDETDWTATLGEALTLAGHAVDAGAPWRLTANARTAKCLKARKARNCEIAVAWELRRGADGPVVYRVVVRGVGHDEGKGDGATRAAVADAATRLVERATFRERLAAGAPTPEAPPKWSGTVTLKRCEMSAAPLPAGMNGAMRATVVLTDGERVGSGVLVSGDGWVLTAAHVVDGAGKLTARTHEGISGPARVIRVDREQDLALVHTIVGGGWCIPVVAASPPPGTEVFAIGSPLGEGLEFSVSKGIVSGAREVAGRQFLQTDASINAGNSGGPLLDPTGHLVGIVSWKVAGTGLEGLAFGVPATIAPGRLDFAWGATSDDPPSPEAVGGKSPGSEIDDTPDVSRLVAPKGEPLNPLTIGGVALGLAGVGVAGGTYFLYLGDYQDPDLTVGEWRAMQVGNAIGWAVAAGGAAMVVIPIYTADARGAAIGVRF